MPCRRIVWRMTSTIAGLSSITRIFGRPADVPAIASSLCGFHAATSDDKSNDVPEYYFPHCSAYVTCRMSQSQAAHLRAVMIANRLLPVKPLFKGRRAGHARAPAKSAELLHATQLLDHRVGVPAKSGGFRGTERVNQVALAQQQSQRRSHALCQRVEVI